VVYNSIDGTNVGVFGPEYNEPGSTFHVFTTYLISNVDQTIHLGLVGDDGHSLFVNNSFATGAGFGGTVNSPNAVYELTLLAGIEVQLTYVGHDAYGSSWSFGITDPQQYGGVTMGAVSAANTVPEPTAIALAGLGGVCLAGRYGRRRHPI
jgi:hypothetical protein